MLETISLGIAGVATVVSHIKSRKFVRKRLRFTSAVEKPYIPIVAGVATAVVAAPVLAVVSLLPLVQLGTGTALLLGAGVGTGVAMGSKPVPTWRRGAGGP